MPAQRSLARALLAATLLAGCAAVWAQEDPGLRPQACLLCHLDLKLWFDFAVGSALLGGLVLALNWMESASLPAITEHLAGLAVVGFVLYLFVRFFAL